ncbi:MAG: cyclodeaminase/cyclohydrolase family protein [Chloroflexota bacterium]|nr:cyclodeaminase/cyclohydrolase family protein [Chloroflexota bacterium]MDE3192626.1 cyclodeaminase/cyclohydrolase family protein [Chloroflexota bacterium]
MTDRLIDRSLRAFSDDLASDRPVPGGGSAAAYAGALGAALCAMVVRITAKKSREDLAARIEELEGLHADFLRLVDDDTAAFGRVAEAMKLPRATDEEKAARKQRMQTGLLGAARVPLELAKTARRLLNACEQTMAVASSATVSDVGVGALMAETALRGAALNVMINLAALEDAGQVKVLSEELDRAVDGSEEQRARVLQFIESRIAR